MTSHRDTTGRTDAPAPGSTSSSLLERLKGRDLQAWERLVDLYGPLIYQWSRQTGLQAEDAADVAQEVFGAVARGLDEFRRQRPGDSFRGWLWTVTRNKIRDHFRRRRNEAQARGGTDAQRQLAEIPHEPPECSTAGPQAAADNLLEHRAVAAVRAGVEERTWQAFWRAAVEGQAPAVVAQDLGISVQAVYDAKYRIRRKIRQELDGLIE